MRYFPICLSLVILLLAGCAAMETKDARETGMVLAEAGFDFKTADTPAKLAHLKTLPQRTIFKSHRNGQLYYLYADAAGCQCLYVGTAADYQRYRSLAWDQYMQTGQERLQYISGDRSTSGGWNDWGPW